MRINLFCLIFLMVFASACEKEAGEGGSSSISGKVFVRNYNSDYTKLNAAYYGAKEDVYIIYGDGTVYNNSMKTSYDGSFKFDYLRKGKYQLFCYSEDSTGTIPSGILTILKEVEITSNHTDIVVDDFVIIK
jgi:hypothetical protein